MRTFSSIGLVAMLIIVPSFVLCAGSEKESFNHDEPKLIRSKAAESVYGKYTHLSKKQIVDMFEFSEKSYLDLRHECNILNITLYERTRELVNNARVGAGVRASDAAKAVKDAAAGVFDSVYSQTCTFTQSTKNWYFQTTATCKNSQVAAVCIMVWELYVDLLEQTQSFDPLKHLNGGHWPEIMLIVGAYRVYFIVWWFYNLATERYYMCAISMILVLAYPVMVMVLVLLQSLYKALRVRKVIHMKLRKLANAIRLEVDEEEIPSRPSVVHEPVEVEAAQSVVHPVKTRPVVTQVISTEAAMPGSTIHDVKRPNYVLRTVQIVTTPEGETKVIDAGLAWRYGDVLIMPFHVRQVSTHIVSRIGGKYIPLPEKGLKCCPNSDFSAQFASSKFWTISECGTAKKLALPRLQTYIKVCELTKGAVGNISEKSTSGPFWLYHNASTTGGGSSGAVVLNESGAVLGMHLGYIDNGDDTGSNYFVFVLPLLKAMGFLGKETTTEASYGEDEEGSLAVFGRQDSRDIRYTGKGIDYAHQLEDDADERAEVYVSKYKMDWFARDTEDRDEFYSADALHLLSLGPLGLDESTQDWEVKAMQEILSKGSTGFSNKWSDRAYNRRFESGIPTSLNLLGGDSGQSTVATEKVAPPPSLDLSTLANAHQQKEAFERQQVLLFQAWLRSERSQAMQPSSSAQQLKTSKGTNTLHVKEMLLNKVSPTPTVETDSLTGSMSSTDPSVAKAAPVVTLESPPVLVAGPALGEKSSQAKKHAKRRAKKRARKAAGLPAQAQPVANPLSKRQQKKAARAANPPVKNGKQPAVAQVKGQKRKAKGAPQGAPNAKKAKKGPAAMPAPSGKNRRQRRAEKFAANPSLIRSPLLTPFVGPGGGSAGPPLLVQMPAGFGLEANQELLSKETLLGPGSGLPVLDVTSTPSEQEVVKMLENMPPGMVKFIFLIIVNPAICDKVKHMKYLFDDPKVTEPELTSVPEKHQPTVDAMKVPAVHEILMEHPWMLKNKLMDPHNLPMMNWECEVAELWDTCMKWIYHPLYPEFAARLPKELNLQGWFSCTPLWFPKVMDLFMTDTAARTAYNLIQEGQVPAWLYVGLDAKRYVLDKQGKTPRTDGKSPKSVSPGSDTATERSVHFSPETKL